MSYLIDTHILLWWLSDDKKLKSKIRRIIATEAVWVSSAVIWEMVIKSELGKLTIPDNIKETIDAEHFNILDIKLPHILELKNLE